jgi:hypothetical protein
MADFPSRAMLKGLITHLKANMASLQEAYDDFPNPNQKLKMPCLSIAGRSPVFNPMMPYVTHKGAQITSGADEDKYPVRRCMGTFDFSFQLDLWARSKPERALLETELMLAFSKNTSAHGISLQLSDYFNEWVRFDIEGFNYPDAEPAAQRGEWRTIVTVLGHCRFIVEKNEFLIETIENNLETPGSIPSDDDENVTTII